MKLAINLTRENVGGITVSNLNLISYLYKLDYEFVGLEINGRPSMKGPSIFRAFDPEIFDHNIINVHHLPIMDVLKKSKTLKDVEVAYSETIKIVRKIIKATPPDVMLLSGTYYMPWILSIAAKKERIPVVLWYSGVLSKEIEGFPKRIQKILVAMERAVVKNSTRMIFPSKLCMKTVEREVLKKQD